MADRLSQGGCIYTREGSMMSDKKKEQKEEKKPSEGTGKEEHHGRITWICPGCGTRYTGWSTLNKCSKCGYEEK